MQAKYPSYPTIEEKFRKKIQTDLDRKTKKNPAYLPSYDFQTWKQLWPDTAGIFAREGYLSGAMMTSSYVTVVFEEDINVWGVFSGDDLAYVVRNPKDAFFEDLWERHMANAGEAAKRY